MRHVAQGGQPGAISPALGACPEPGYPPAMAKRKRKTNTRYAVLSAVKDHVAKKGMRTGGDFIDALNDEIADLLDDAVERAKDNGRATVRASDL